MPPCVIVGDKLGNGTIWWGGKSDASAAKPREDVVLMFPKPFRSLFEVRPRKGVYLVDEERRRMKNSVRVEKISFSKSKRARTKRTVKRLPDRQVAIDLGAGMVCLSLSRAVMSLVYYYGYLDDTRVCCEFLVRIQDTHASDDWALCRA